MAKKRLFISFAVENRLSRDFFVGQRNNDASPFDFTDMSVKEPWEPDEWQARCNSKIKGCDGMIVLLSPHTEKASGVLWEIKCAQDAGIPIMGIVIKRDEWPFTLPYGLDSNDVFWWEWDSIHAFINKL